MTLRRCQNESNNWNARYNSLAGSNTRIDIDFRCCIQSCRREENGKKKKKQKKKGGEGNFLIGQSGWSRLTLEFDKNVGETKKKNRIDCV